MKAGIVIRCAITATLLTGMSGCSKEAATPVPETPKTFTIHGTVTTPADITTSDATIGGHCFAEDGYTDMKDGAQVTITDQAGTVVAVGHLGDGNTASNEMGIAGAFVDTEIASTCSWPFYISGVPEDRTFYGVAIGRRDPVRYTRDELQTALALGVGL